MAVPEFSLKEAQVHVTMACIAYAGQTLNEDDPTPDQLRAAVTAQLTERPHYATGKRWSLVWGPVEAKDYDNLVYAAYNAKESVLALSIRGTSKQAWSKVEDVPLYTSAFPPDVPAARVSGPFLTGLKTMLAAADSRTGETLAAFYARFAAEADIVRLVVNGHSQGAALVPMVMLALDRGTAGAPQVAEPISGYAFAPPTSGNPAFAALVDAQCNCWFVINPKDVVPLGYASMRDVIRKGIPEVLHGLEYETVKLGIKALEALIDPDDWAQPYRQVMLEPTPVHGVGLFGQIDDQHNHNTYAVKLGAPGTDVGKPSVFPVAAVPKLIRREASASGGASRARSRPARPR